MKLVKIAAIAITAVLMSAGAGTDPTVRFDIESESFVSAGKTEFEIPISVAGGPITAYLDIIDLGNNDTCVYISPTYILNDGWHVFTWNLIDRNGDIVAPVTYNDFIYWKRYLLRLNYEDSEGRSFFPAMQGTELYFTYNCIEMDIVHPNGGEKLVAGTEYTIEWIESYARKPAIIDVPSTDVYLSSDAGKTWMSFDHGVHGNLTLTLPVVNSDSCLVKVLKQRYRTEDISDNFFTITTPTSVGESPLPAAFAAGPASPNPFNPTTTIPMNLPVPGHVRAVVYNLTGQRVAVLADGEFATGRHTLTWNASGSATGVYVCRVEYAGKTRAVKVTLAK